MQRPVDGKCYGFTLIELSIVLVIIGFIVAGIMVGNSMIRQSQLLSSVSDEQRYVQAIGQFQQKYNYLPGDMPTATSYWGTNPNCATGGAGTGTQTCNGSGSNQISGMESIYAWQHLANAGMISGSFSGASKNMSGGGQDEPGYNVPQSKLANAGFSLFYVPTTGLGGGWYAANYGHVLEFGAQDNIYYQDTWIPVIAASEAYNIDLKYDDGLPSTGNILVQNTTVDSCATAGAQYNASTTNSSLVCQVIYITGF